LGLATAAIYRELGRSHARATGFAQVAIELPVTTASRDVDAAESSQLAPSLAVAVIELHRRAIVVTAALRVGLTELGIKGRAFAIAHAEADIGPSRILRGRVGRLSTARDATDDTRNEQEAAKHRNK
jgi:hypothetical protein